MKPYIAFAILLSAFQLFSFSAFGQGSLTPPGPPAPTMKKLDEVEPRTNLQATPAPAGVDTSNADYHFIINQPGSYYLSANIVVTKANGIQINAEGVTLDLNGFQISQVSPSGNGIEMPNMSHRTTVRNGTVKGFVSGIVGGAKACAFRDLAVTGCTTYGIVTGPGAVLESCRAHDNSGIAAIATGQGSTVSNCVANGNTTTYGISVNYNSAVTNCSAFSNTGLYGIHAYAGSTLTNCSAAFNIGTGTGSGGIYAGAGATVTHCSAYYNNSTGVSSPSTGMGFILNSGSTIQNCTAYLNFGDGIRVSSDCVVRENISGANNIFVAAGIHSTGSSNRIEGNTVMTSSVGINADVAGNVMVQNTARQNTTNYHIAANNVFGAIVDRTAAVSAVVSGNSAPSTAGTTDPWANISY